MLRTGFKDKAVAAAAAVARNPLLHLCLIFALGLLAYSNTLDAPFQWDDRFGLLQGNPIVEDLGYFADPSKAEGLEQYPLLRRRYIGMLSFAINYRLHGLDVTGYHVFNLVVHLLNAALVYAIVLLTFRTPFLARSALRGNSTLVALFTALFFVSHPMLTEAVTYVFQRLASLMAFFYLVSVASYAGSRLSSGRTARYALYALSLSSAVLAMKTKENAFTLPLMVAIYEFMFLSGTAERTRARLARLAPFCLTLAIVPLSLVGPGTPVSGLPGELASASAGYAGISRYEYLVTQFHVIAKYVRMMFVPIGQNADIDHPLYGSLTEPGVLVPLVLLCSVLLLAAFLTLRSRKRGADLRLIGFGVFWFFVTLSVESSVIPLPMVVTEYRLYLPSIGMLLAFMVSMFLLLYTSRSARARALTISFLVVTPLVFSAVTYSRNVIWTTEIGFWQDVTAKSPDKARGHYNLGLGYHRSGLSNKAVENYLKAISLKPDHEKAHLNLGNAYLEKGMIDNAIEHYGTSLKIKPDYAGAHYNMGLAYMKKNMHRMSARYFRRAAELDPALDKAGKGLGLPYDRVWLNNGTDGSLMVTTP